MDYSWLFIGAMAGLLFGTIFIGVGIIVGGINGTDKRHNNDIPDGDSDIRIYVPCRCRDRGGGHGSHTVEEKVMMLNTMRVGATWYEKTLIDEISDDLIELDAIKFLKENENEQNNFNR